MMNKMEMQKSVSLLTFKWESDEQDGDAKVSLAVNIQQSLLSGIIYIKFIMPVGIITL